jgi:hypothetical protein
MDKDSLMATRCDVSRTIRAVVCGSSVYMAALAASLQANADVEVQRIPADPIALRQSLAGPAPVLVAFDLGEMSGDLVISLLRDHQQLILVGVDPSSDRMLVLSGRQEQPVSAAELLLAITGDLA